MDILHYSTHALSDLERHMKVLDKKPNEPFRNTIPQLSEYLRQGHKFQLPDYGRFFEEGKWIQWNASPFKLPYPLVVLEYTCPPTEQELKHPDPKTLYVHKRIVIAGTREGAKLVDGFYQLTDEYIRKTDKESPQPWGEADWLFLWPIYFFHEHWFPSWCGAVFPLGEEFLVEPKESDVGFADVKDRPPAGFKTMQFRALTHRRSGNDFSTMQSIHDDLIDEIVALKQFCQVLSCKNIGTTQVHPPPKLNKSRLRKGKRPFFSYHVVVLNKEHHERETRVGLGSHASPRFHWRRGHIRVLPSGVKTWVSPHTVGNSKLGVVDKDYVVSKT